MWYPWISLRLRAFYLARKGCWMAHCSSVCCPAWTWISRSRSRLLLLYESEKWRLRNFWCREFSELMPLQRHRKIRSELLKNALSQIVVLPFILTCQDEMIRLTQRKTGVFLLSVCIPLLSKYTYLLFFCSVSWYSSALNVLPCTFYPSPNLTSTH